MRENAEYKSPAGRHKLERRRGFMKKKLLAILLCLVLCLTAVPQPAKAQEEIKLSYVALGDSISTGYLLENPESEGFAALVAKDTYNLTNLSKNGNTAEGIIGQLETEEVSLAVENADIISITCGGNDLMNALYDAIADSYNDAKGTDFTGDDVKKELVDGSSTDMSFGFAELNILLGVINTFTESDAFKAAHSSYIDNMFGEGGVVYKILEINPDVTIIFITQYNPYIVFKSDMIYSNLYKGIEAGVCELNKTISENATSGGHLVADAYTAFAQSNENLCNASTGNGSSNLDFHPNKAGHEVIADVVRSALGADISESFTVEVSYDDSMGTVTGDGSYADGSQVTLAATPSLYYIFTGWYDEDKEFVSGDASYTFQIEDNVSYSAVFEPERVVSVRPTIYDSEEEYINWGETYEGEELDKDIILLGEPVTLDTEDFPESITVDDKKYKFVGYMTAVDTSPTESITIPAVPVSSQQEEYGAWMQNYADGIRAVYLLEDEEASDDVIYVPIMGNDKVVRVDTRIKNNMAIVEYDEADNLNPIFDIGDDIELHPVIIDLSGLSGIDVSITGVELPVELVEEVSKETNSRDSNIDGLRIEFPGQTATEFDSEALRGLASQAVGDDITVSIQEADKDKLTAPQKHFIGDRPAYDATVTSDGQVISQIGGEISIEIPYELRDGELAENLVVYYVSDNGETQEHRTLYDKEASRIITFTGHFSVYVIGYKADTTNEPNNTEALVTTGEVNNTEAPTSTQTSNNTQASVATGEITPSTGDNSNMTMCIIILLVSGGLALALCERKRKNLI